MCFLYPAPTTLGEERKVIDGRYQDLTWLEREHDEDLVLARTVEETPRFQMIAVEAGDVCDLGPSEGYQTFSAEESAVVLTWSPPDDEGQHHLRIVDASCEDFAGPFEIRGQPVVGEFVGHDATVAVVLFVDVDGTLRYYYPHLSEVGELGKGMRSLAGTGFGSSIAATFDNVFAEDDRGVPHEVRRQQGTQAYGLYLDARLALDAGDTVLRYEFLGSDPSDCVADLEDAEGTRSVAMYGVRQPDCNARVVGDDIVVFETPCGSSNRFLWLRHVTSAYRNIYRLPTLATDTEWVACDGGDIFLQGPALADGGHTLFSAPLEESPDPPPSFDHEEVPTLAITERHHGVSCRYLGFAHYCLVGVDGGWGTFSRFDPSDEATSLFEPLASGVRDYVGSENSEGWLLSGKGPESEDSLIALTAGETTSIGSSIGLVDLNEEPRRVKMERWRRELGATRGDAAPDWLLVTDVDDGQGALRRVNATDAVVTVSEPLVQGVLPETARWLLGDQMVGYMTDETTLEVHVPASAAQFRVASDVAEWTPIPTGLLYAVTDGARAGVWRVKPR